MIYTVTFNPAIDYIVHTDSQENGGVMRSCREEFYIGGKGLNVSQILKALDCPTKAFGFVAGFTGDAIEKGIRDKGIDAYLIHLQKGFSRINVKVKAEKELEINGQGPCIGEEDLLKLFDALDVLKDGDTLVLAGSIPSSLPQDIYEQILKRQQEKNLRIVVDATGDLLVNVLKYHPFLIKPNNFELGEIFGKTLSGNDEIIHYAKKLQEMGARNVLVSMAGDGAILIDEMNKVYHCPVCKGVVKNSVGAGDSMVAGFLAGYEKENDYEYALKLGTAAGGATAFSDGLARAEEIYRLYEELIEKG